MKKSRASSDAVEKAEEKKLKPRHFLAWIDEHVRTRDSKTNITPSVVEAFEERKKERRRRRRGTITRFLKISRFAK